MDTAPHDTRRLVLRPFEPSDAAFLVRLNADVEVVRYTGDRAFTSQHEAAAVVASLIQQWESRRLGRLLVLHKESGDALGWCGLKWHDQEQAVDLGFRLLRSAWRRGYATEAGRRCLDIADRRHLRVFARAMPQNIVSLAVLAKLGFTPVPGIDADGFQAFELRYAVPASATRSGGASQKKTHNA